MNRPTLQGILDDLSPGRFLVAALREKNGMQVHVRLLGTKVLFVRRFCAEEIIGSAGPGAALALACARVSQAVEDERVHAAMCNMDLADFVMQASEKLVSHATFG